LVIEAGTVVDDMDVVKIPINWENTPGTPMDYNDLIQPGEIANFDITKRHLSAGKALGGTSNLNSEMYVRGNPDDYNTWAALGATGWTYAEVLPHFKNVETSSRYASNPAYHGNSGPLHVGPGGWLPDQDNLLVQAAANIGIPFNPDWNGAQQILSSNGSSGFHELTIWNGTRQEAFGSFLRPILSRPNLWVMDSASVRRVRFNNQKQAVAVEWTDNLNGGEYVSRANKEIILSMGTQRTSQILRISGVGNATELASLGIPVVHNLPGVGENLQDHPIATFTYGTPLQPVPGSSVDQAAWDLYNYNHTGVIASITARCNVFIRTSQVPANDPRPDIQVIYTTPGPSVFGLVYLLRPSSRGRVNLFSRDPTDRPLPSMNYFTDAAGHDMKAITEGLRRAIQLVQAPPINAFAQYSGPSNLSDDASVAQYILGNAAYYQLANTNSGQHLTGTCKMGAASDPMAVVDGRLRVYGVSGLRIADASVMPAMPSGNTQAPSYMIGDKAAYMILADNA
jgi:choline dehydrogenase